MQLIVAILLALGLDASALVNEPETAVERGGAWHLRLESSDLDDCASPRFETRIFYPGVFSTGALHRGGLYVWGPDGVLRLDPRTGRRRWEYRPDGACVNAFAMGRDGMVVVERPKEGSADSSVVLVDRASGRRLRGTDVPGRPFMGAFQTHGSRSFAFEPRTASETDS